MKEDRREEIIRLLAEQQTVKAKDLAAFFGVSMETVRRDLEELEYSHLIRRTHGGAVLTLPAAGLEPDYAKRTLESYEKKRRIGKRAADTVRPGDTLIIDIGTTTLELAHFLHGKRELTVFTNSLKIAAELMSDDGIAVYFLGGRIRGGEGSTSGGWAERAVDSVYADKYFLGVGAWDPASGICDFHFEETELRRHCLAHAKEVIALTDSSKFNRTALNLVCRTEEVSTLITDDDVSRQTVRDLHDRGVSVLTV